METSLLCFNSQAIQREFQKLSDEWGVVQFWSSQRCDMVAIMEYGASIFQYHCAWPFITDMMSVMKGHVQLYWKIRGPYSDMGYTTQLRLLRTGQGNNTRTPLNWNANQCSSSAGINTIYCSPNQRSRKTVLKILFARSLIVNRNPINAGDANLMGQMLVGLRRKKEEVKHPIMLEKDPWVHPLRLQQR